MSLIKKAIEDKQQLLARYEGKEESVQRRFEELGCASFDAAQHELTELDNNLRVIKEQYAAKLSDFQEKFPQLFEEQ